MKSSKPSKLLSKLPSLKMPTVKSLIRITTMLLLLKSTPSEPKRLKNYTKLNTIRKNTKLKSES